MVSIKAKPVSGVVSAKPASDLRGFWFRGSAPDLGFPLSGGIWMSALNVLSKFPNRLRGVYDEG
ncbi:MAG TPA: hypothetical protein VE465_01950 [Streptosporangiaceae bacterium]|jgi:hypothetical protein|nr:hypothetical protein [Streptosporangiaceae bacterium]